MLLPYIKNDVLVRCRYLGTVPTGSVTVPYSTVHIYNIARLPYGTVPYGTLTATNMYVPLRQVVLLFNIA